MYLSTNCLFNGELLLLIQYVINKEQQVTEPSHRFDLPTSLGRLVSFGTI